MLKRILTAAILAGAVGGLFASALQGLRLAPLIHEAEVYEQAAQAAATAPHDHASLPPHDHAPLVTREQAAQAAHDPGQDHGEGAEWMPAEDFARTAFTALANVVAAIGFGLLLAVCYALNGDVDAKRGVVWGLAGFAAFHLAPSLGLPPELPGAAAAALYDRQIWWIATAAATAGGLATAVFARGRAAKAAGIALIVLPHIIGAPAPEGPSAVPAELAASFVAGSLAVAAAFWALLGGMTGYFFRAFAPQR
jgi:cobalt transporter subunit CbtA